MTAEFYQYHDPSRIFILFYNIIFLLFLESLNLLKHIRNQFTPCCLLYQRIGQCYMCLHQFKDAIQWYERVGILHNILLSSLFQLFLLLYVTLFFSFSFFIKFI